MGGVFGSMADSIDKLNNNYYRMWHKEILSEAKLTKTLPKIDANATSPLMKQWEDYALFMQRNEISSWGGYMRYTEEALQGKTKIAVTGAYLREPGASLLENSKANANIPSHKSHMELYKWVKQVTLYRINSQGEHPGPGAKKARKAIKLDGKLSWAQVQAFTDSLEVARINMVRYGLFDGTPHAQEEEMRDLEEKSRKERK